MADRGEHSVGLRDLRHQTREVIARVQAGEALDVTDYGRLVARIVPVADRPRTPVLTQLIAAGRVSPATRPGFRPRMRNSSGSDVLGAALEEDRNDR